MTDVITIPNSKSTGVFVRMIKNGGDPVPLPPEARRQRINQVWLVINEAAIRSIGLRHRHTAIQQDRLGDWQIHGDRLQYYGHAASLGDECDLLLVVD